MVVVGGSGGLGRVVRAEEGKKGRGRVRSFKKREGEGGLDGCWRSRSCQETIWVLGGNRGGKQV